MNQGVRLCGDRKNHCKDILEDNIEDKWNIHALIWGVYKKYQEYLIKIFCIGSISKKG